VQLSRFGSSTSATCCLRSAAYTRRDHHVRGADHTGTGQLVHVVEFSEPAAVLRSRVVLELPQRLIAQIVPVDEEQHPPQTRVPEQPVARGHRGVGLAGTGCHLHQRAPDLLLGEGLLDTADSCDLRWPQPVGLQPRHQPHLATPGRRVRTRLGIAQRPGQRLRPRELKDRLGPRPRVITIGEMGSPSRALQTRTAAARRP